VKTTITANMSPRRVAVVHTDATVGMLGFAATVHRY
jgi:hypothetical protein